MYRIDTGQARTDLYGIDKGTAQVFDTKPLEVAFDKRNDKIFAEKQLKAKQEKDREDDILKNLSNMGGVKIMARDQPLFAQKSVEIRDYVKKNYEQLLSGDAEAMMGFQKLYGDYKTQADLSQNARENWEIISKEALLDPNVRPESKESILNFAHSDNIGNYTFDPSIVKKNFDYNDRVVNELSPFAQRMAKESPTTKKFTLSQAKDTIADDLKDAVRYEQAAYDFNKAENKLGATNPIEYYQKLYAPKLVVDDKKLAAEWYYGGGGSKDKFPPVSAVVRNNSDGTASYSFNFKDKPDNPYLTIPDPDNQENTLDLRPLEVIKGKDGKIVLKATTKPRMISGTEVPGKVKYIDYNAVADVLTNTYGFQNPQDLFEGNTPSHVTAKYYNIDKPKNNTKTINGVPYTLDELKAMAKSAGKSESDAEKMWNSVK